MFGFVPRNRGYSDDDLSKVQEKCLWVSSFFLKKGSAARVSPTVSQRATSSDYNLSIWQIFAIWKLEKLLTF